MSCCNSCGQEIIVNVPGLKGNNGANGLNAVSQLSSITFAPGGTTGVIVGVSSNQWMGIGQHVFVSDNVVGSGNFATMIITSFPAGGNQFVGTFLGYPNDKNSGMISIGTVSPGGYLPTTPISIANGGSGQATKGAAQTAFGLGQNSLVSTVSGLTQAITATPSEVGACSVTVAALGEYLITATAVISMTGVTFASSRTITLKVRNTVQNVDLATVTFPTQIQTTAPFPSFSLTVPFVIDGTAAINDTIQLFISIDVINSAGTLNVISGNLAYTPLRLS